jgi:hypothetical protein
MAFKPMHYFRKNQKVILAIITIGTMILFVLGDALMGARGGAGSGGRRGGLINWVRNLFSSSHEDAVALVNGHGMDPEKLLEEYHARLLGAALVDNVFRGGESLYLQSLGFSEQDFSDEAKYNAKMRDVMAKNPSAQDALFGRMSTLSSQTYPTLNFQAPYNRAVYSISPDPEALVEFEYWKGKADALGITLTPALVKDDLLNLGLKKVTEADLNGVVRAMAAGTRPGRSPMKLDAVVAVIGDEIRVHLAKQILQQERASFFGSNANPQLTPLDLWNSYVAVKTSLNTGILPLKVEDYLNRVPEPSAAEKQEYYDKYKKEYPDPDRETPGFKIPPLYKIGFVYADLKETEPARKHYDQWVEVMDYLNPYTALGSLVDDYNKKKDVGYRVSQPFLEFTFAKPAAAGPWYRLYKPYSPLDQAGAAGLVASIGSALAQTNTLAPFDLYGFNFRGQTVNKTQTDAAALAGTLGQLAAGFGGLFQAPATVREGNSDVYRPFETVAGAIMNQRHETYSKLYLSKDLDQLTNDLNEYAKRYSEWRGKVLRKVATSTTPPFFKEAEKQTLGDYLTKFATQRGLVYHETKDFRSRLDLLKEEGERLLNTFIKPLYADERIKAEKDVAERVKSSLVGDELRGSKKKLFEATNTDAISFKPNSLQVALHWVAEATEPRVPDLKECEAQVVKAWKMEKARPLVEEEAQKIIKNIQSAPDNERILIDTKGYAVGQTIARFREPIIRAMAVGTSYETSPVPAMLENEPSDLIKQCLDKLHKKGDMTVISNKPKNIYYLFYLRDRSEPKINNPIDVEAFHMDVIRPSLQRPFMVDNQNFRTFAMAEKNQISATEWKDYVKKLTAFNPEEAKRFTEMASKDR